MLASCAGVDLKSYLPKNEKKVEDAFRPIWIKNFDPKFDSGNLPIALMGPGVFDGIVYTGDNNGFFHAFELSNGREVWSVFDGSTYHSAPSFYDDKVIYGTSNGRVIARSLKNGNEVFYNVDLGAPIESKGTVYKDKIIFHLRNHQVFCLDISTGKILWGFKKTISYLTTLQHVSSPIVYKNKVYIGFADGTLAALSLEEGVLLFETKLSSATKFLDVDSDPYIFNDQIFIGSQSNPVVILDPQTGKIVKKADFISLRSPVAFGDKLIYGTNLGEIVVTDKNLNVSKKMSISKSSFTSIIKHRDSIIIGNLTGEVWSINPSDLSIQGKFELGHAYSAIFTDIVSSETNLLIMSSRNRLFVF